MLMGSIMFVISGFWSLLRSEICIYMPWIDKVMGIVSILFFGSAIRVAIKAIMNKSAGVIITEEGFIDNSTEVRTGFVSWGDVLEIKESAVLHIRFLIIIVKNPQDYILRQTNLLK